jgi:RNA polymerase sigma factor (sigma-70 family)
MTLSATDANTTDADLITLSRSGDRRAFGQIVRRYQAMISGLIYAACGDLHRSEDVAQETFISAWKSLSGLRDAAKLPGWLCQIARRRLADQSRSTAAKEIQFSRAFETDQEPAAPVPDTATAEEAEMLWRTLSQIPQPYRETLVLFYRQEKSTAQVAAAMETTEASVRQRLTRGRQMLREEVAAILERNLVRTSPNQLFTHQVVAALPALAAQSAGLGATAKAASAVKGGALLVILLGWLAPIGFLFGLIFGTVQDIRQSQTQRLRRLTVWRSVWLWGVIITCVVVINAALRIATNLHWDLATRSMMFCIVGTLFAMSLFGVIVFGRWRMIRLLNEEGLADAPFPKLATWKRLVFTLPVVAISLAWLVRLAMLAGDQTSVNIISAAIVAESLWLAWRMPRLQPGNEIQQSFETFALALLVIVIMLNWKLHDWIATIYGLDFSQMPHILPMWGINAAALILFAWIGTLTFLSRAPVTQTKLTAGCA